MPSFDEKLVMMAAHAQSSVPPPPRTEPARSSALRYLPHLIGNDAMGLLIPRTEIVLFNYRDAFPMLDGQEAPNLPWGEFKAAAERIGFPVFVRTDLASAKHFGPNAYRLGFADNLPQIIFNTFEDTCLKGLEHDTMAFLFREWIDIPGPFTAFDGHPIGAEWRVFADKGGTICSHFYWPKEALEGNLDDDVDVKLIIPIREGLTEEDQGYLYDAAFWAAMRCAVSKENDHIWSVDFAQDRNGKWWLIDMAAGNESWHPEDCPRRAQSRA